MNNDMADFANVENKKGTAAQYNLVKRMCSN